MAEKPAMKKTAAAKKAKRSRRIKTSIPKPIRNRPVNKEPRAMLLPASRNGSLWKKNRNIFVFQKKRASF